MEADWTNYLSIAFDTCLVNSHQREQEANILFTEKKLRCTSFFSFKCKKRHPGNLSLSPFIQRPLSNPTLATVAIHRKPVKLSAEANTPKRCAYGTCKNLTADTQEVQREVLKVLLSHSQNPKKRDVGYGQSSAEDSWNSSKMNGNTFVSLTDQVGFGPNKYFEIMFRSDQKQSRVEMN